MIWENTKLLLGLLYRPVSSMGRIVDEGHWLYAAVVVAALSMIFHATVTSVIYDNVEAVYRELPAEPVAPDPEEGYDEEEAEAAARKKCVEQARSNYREVVEIFTGPPYVSVRKQATAGLSRLP